MMGPLYHLTRRKDRIAVLKEAYRVLRPRGLLFAASISRYASLIDGLRYKFLKDPAFRRIVEHDLRTGQHRNTTGNPNYFTTSFFHHPNELTLEVEEAGFTQARVFAVESLASLLTLHDTDTLLKNKKTAQRIFRMLAAVEREPTLLGASAHMLTVATKPTSQKAGAR
jgi:ubiquinone/menaquinone biosynthesis C-methylase UbiE